MSNDAIRTFNLIQATETDLTYFGNLFAFLDLNSAVDGHPEEKTLHAINVQLSPNGGERTGLDRGLFLNSKVKPD